MVVCFLSIGQQLSIYPWQNSGGDIERGNLSQFQTKQIPTVLQFLLTLSADGSLVRVGSGWVVLCCWDNLSEEVANYYYSSNCCCCCLLLSGLVRTVTSGKPDILYSSKNFSLLLSMQWASKFCRELLKNTQYSRMYYSTKYWNLIVESPHIALITYFLSTLLKDVLQ